MVGCRTTFALAFNATSGFQFQGAGLSLRGVGRHLVDVSLGFQCDLQLGFSVQGEKFRVQGFGFWVHP